MARLWSLRRVPGGRLRGAVPAPAAEAHRRWQKLPQVRGPSPETPRVPELLAEWGSLLLYKVLILFVIFSKLNTHHADRFPVL